MSAARTKRYNYEPQPRENKWREEPYGASSEQCKCNCPVQCQHDWAGQLLTLADGKQKTETCARCGMNKITHDLWAINKTEAEIFARRDNNNVN